MPLALAVGAGDGGGVPGAARGARRRPAHVVLASSGSSATTTCDGVVVDGETVPADLVLIGVGAVPNTGLASGRRAPVDNGILVGRLLRTSAPDVYAAGDVANAYHPVIQRHLRSEHWANALNAGPVAARAMLGQGRVHGASRTSTRISSTSAWSCPATRRSWRALTWSSAATVTQREFIAFWVDDGRVVGG